MPVEGARSGIIAQVTAADQGGRCSRTGQDRLSGLRPALSSADDISGRHNLGRRYEEAVLLIHLGDTHHATGNPEAARTAWQQALTILDQLDHPDADQVRTRLTALDTPSATT